MFHLNDEILFFQQITRPRNKVVPVHNHNCYEIVYYKKCDGSIELDGKPCPFKNNTFSFSKPQTWQIESHFEEGELLFIGFQCRNTIDMPNGVYDDDEDFSMQKIINEIYLECSRQKRDYQKMVQLKIQELQILLERFKNRSAYTAYNFNYAVNFIRENYQHKVDFNNLAKSCGYSYDYFRHQFLKMTGQSPRNYLIEVRLNAAENLLRTTTLNCTEIAYQCGFYNSAQFSSIFKEKYGNSPSTYRRKNCR